VDSAGTGGEDAEDAFSRMSLSAKKISHYRALLRKMSYEDETFYAPSPPFTKNPQLTGANYFSLLF